MVRRFARLFTIAALLHAPAHRVEVAGTGAEGLERIGSESPDVILLDLALPDQSRLLFCGPQRGGAMACRKADHPPHTAPGRGFRANSGGGER
jgi:CheY-like chemotaxis protein